MSVITYLKKLIAINKLHETFDVLSELSPQFDKDHQSIIIILSARYTKYLQDKRKGILSNKDEKLQHRQLVNSLLNLVSDFPDELKFDNVKKKEDYLNRQYFIYRNRYLIWIILFSSIGLVLLYTSLVQKKDVKIEIEFQVERFEFVTEELIQLDLKREQKSITLADQFELKIPAKRMHILPSNQLTRRMDTQIQSLMEVSSNKNMASSLTMDIISLESLEIYKDTRVLIETFEDLDFTKITFVRGKTNGKIGYKDSLYFQCNYCLINTNDEVQEIDFLEAMVFNDEITLIDFENKDELLTLELESDSSALYILNHQADFFIKSLSFIVPDFNESVESSIIKGNLKFLDGKDRSYYLSPIMNGEYLQLGKEDLLEIKSLIILDNKIELKAKGSVKVVRTGKEPELLYSRNPSLLHWLIHGNPLVLILIVGLPILLSIGLLIYIRI